MSTFLFDKIIFGPINSRRLGKSLGINLLPDNAKFCNYNCIYCECGWSNNKTIPVLPTSTEVSKALEDYMQIAVNQDNIPDVITFAGNGEPTLHPEFSKIIDITCSLRDKYMPLVKVVVLSNATRLHLDKISESLNKVDMAILKIDTVIQKDYELLNNPVGIKIDEIVELICAKIKRPIIQTMFLKARIGNYDFDNTTENSLTLYFEALKKISPIEVMIYSVSRETPMSGITSADLKTLNLIGQKIEQLGFKTLITP